MHRSFSLLLCALLLGCPSPPTDPTDLSVPDPDGSVSEDLASGDDAAPADPPRAAPACPPGVMRVTDIAQLSDADRYNGRARVDAGTVPNGAPLAGDPAQNGPFRSLESAVRVPRPMGEAGTLQGSFYAPSLDGATVAPGPFPLVLVMPGFGARFSNYQKYSHHLATHGFVVLGMDTNTGGLMAEHQLEAVRAQFAITWALTQSALASRIDGTKIAVAGHSKGGKVAFLTAALDPRVDVVIGWDPSNAGGPPCAFSPVECHSQPAAPNCNAPSGAEGVLHRMSAETLVLGVPPDALNPEATHNALNFYRGAPSPATYLFLRGAHADFVTEGLGGGNARVHMLTMRTQAGYLLTRFRGITVGGAYLPGGAQFDPDNLLQRPAQRK